MKYGKVTFLTMILMTICFTVALGAAEEIVIDTSDSYVKKCFEFLDTYWDAQECKYRFEEAPFNSDSAMDLQKIYITLARKLKGDGEELGKNVTKSLFMKNKNTLISLSNFYKSLPGPDRPPFYSVADYVLTYMVKEEMKKEPADPAVIRQKFEQEYFPGFGYADPKFMYRRGKEVERKFLQAYWKVEKETIESTNYMEMTIAVEMMASLQAQVDFLKILNLFKIEINGKLVAAAKVSFQTKKTLVTEAKVKYEKNKIWFELMQARKDYWSTPKWELAGKTYMFMEEPTGEELVVSSGSAPANPETPGKSLDITMEEENQIYKNILEETVFQMISGNKDYLKLFVDYYNNASPEQLKESAEFFKLLKDYYTYYSLNHGGFQTEIHQLMKTVK